MTKQHNTYGRVEQFFGEILGRYELLYTETDFILRDTNGKSCLYYPKSFQKVINTKPVKRLSRIFQLGTKIYTRPNVSHTRLEHSKGTYYRTLEFLQNLYEQKNIKDIIIKNEYQKYILAILVRALLHDVGHGPFSHTMEVVCGLPKGFHEKIGFRLIKEDPELNEALNDIYQGLPELIEETIEKNFLGLNRIFEGQSDLDRGDFLPRDSFFAGINFEENSKIVSELFNNISLEKIVGSDGKSRLVPVFAENQIGNLDIFFTNRFNNYKDIYYNPKAISYDYVFKAFAETLLANDEEFKLKDFLLHNKDKKPEEIDLQEYVSFDDVEYLKGIMEVADKTKNPILRELALMSFPPKERAMDFYYGLMISEEQVDENGNRQYTNAEDEEFVRRLTNLIDSKTEYEQNCLILNNNSQENIDNILKELKLVLEIGDEELEKHGIFLWNNKITSYKNKPGEETYVKGEDGKVYEYSQHPERKAPLQTIDVPGFCVLIPILQQNGYTAKQIDEVKKLIEANNKRFEYGEVK